MKRPRISWAEVMENMSRLEHDQRLQRTIFKTTMANLSAAIMANILLRLPPKALMKCRCVCKTWRNFILNPQFTKLYLERSASQEVMLRSDGPGSLSRTVYLIDLDELKPYAEFVLPQNDDLAFSGIDIVNSCNGLVCLCSYIDKNPVLVCNPITREYINIPRIDKQKPKSPVSFCNNPIDCECALCLAYNGKVESEKELVASGFGFSPKTNQYKVIRIFKQGYSHGFGGLNSYGKTAEIYTLGERSWRSIEFSPQFPHSLLFGTYLKETMHWVCANNDDVPEFIVSFNFQNEKFEVLSLPPFFNADKKLDISMIRMQELGGCLSVCDFFSAKVIDVWVMKDYGAKLWTKGYVVYMLHGRICVPIKLLNKEEILMIQGLKGLISYNSSRMKIKYHKIRGIQSYFGASIHMPSFVSLKDIVKGDSTEVFTAKN